MVPARINGLEDEVENILPPIISNNPREKLNAEQVSLSFLMLKEKRNEVVKKNILCQELSQPLYALNLAYYPKIIYFEIDDKIKVQKLRVWNASRRSVLIICSCFHESEVFSIRCYPRTRSLLAPGLSADFFAIIRSGYITSVSSTSLTLLIKAAHLRDSAVTTYHIPVVVTFLNFKPTCFNGNE